MLIGLNSVMFSPHHHATIQAMQQQMNFLKKQLVLAKKQGISVIIAMHIPVGNNVYDGLAFWKPTAQKTFLSIIRSYHQYIRGILVAHTHMEEFKIITIPKSQDIGEYFTAGLSTSHGNSPSIKVFTMTDTNYPWSINNYIAYQIHKHHNTIVLSKYYYFTDTYCKDMTTLVDINSCLKHIQFHSILPRYTVNNPHYKDYKVQSPQSFYVH